MTSWVNGRLGGEVDGRDRGLAYGDGLFETLRVRRGAVRLLAYHLERLEDGCRRLAIRPPNLPRLRNELRRAAAQRAEAVLKLIVTRGVGSRGYRPSGAERTTRILTLYPLKPAASRLVESPVRIRMCSTRLGTNEALAGMKTLNRLESVLARSEWTDPRIWEGLMRDADGNIVCGTMSNVLVNHGSTLLTPPLDRCGIAGVMRRWVLEQAESIGVHVRIARLGWSDLRSANEVFMTNAVAGVVSVAAIHDGRLRLKFEGRRLADALRTQLDEQ